MLNQVMDKALFVIGAAFFISDLLFPLWLVGIVFFLKRRKGWAFWKAYAVASTFCLIQAYSVAKLIGYNIGAYALIGIGDIAGSLFYDLPPGVTITSHLTPFQLSLVFWVAPPITVIILPTFILFLVSRFGGHGIVSNFSCYR